MFGVVLGKAIETSKALIALSLHSSPAMRNASRANKVNGFNGRGLYLKMTLTTPDSTHRGEQSSTRVDSMRHTGFSRSPAFKR